MIALLLVHLVVGLGIVLTGSRLGHRGVFVALAAPAVAVAWLATKASAVLDGEVVRETVSWVPDLGLTFDLRLDGFALLMALLVSGIGVLVFAYAASYLSRSGEAEGRLLGLLVLFSGAMFGLVVADNVLVVYLFWEITSVTSYLLIGNKHTDPRPRAAALHALLVTTMGALAMLGGFIILGQQAGTFQLSGILAAAPSGHLVNVALVLVLAGAFTKSAQWPFSSWLPGAMVARTPVSAYLHSATMVKAGIYLIARFAPVFAVMGWWRPLVLVVGSITMLVGGYRALKQWDLKVLLAFGTISQLGFLTILFGVGTAEATTAGCLMLLAHAVFKATLFMVVGIIDHQTGTRDVRALRHLGPSWVPLEIVAVIAGLSMAGLPLAFGFVAKEQALAALTDGGFTGATAVVAVVVVGSMLTFGYTVRFLWGAFLAPDPGTAIDKETVAAAQAPKVGFLAPAVVLTAVTVVAGIVPGVLDSLLGKATASLGGTSPEPGQDLHLAVWHGFNLPLGLSGAIVVGGLAVFLLRRPIAASFPRRSALPRNSVYLASLRSLNTIADRVTGVLQSGSLPTYCGVILLTAAVLPTGALLLGGAWPGLPKGLETLGHIPVAIVLLGGAVAAANVGRRFSAALFLGVVGYAMALLFVLQGAPDLALTQIAIETLSTVLFVLVLRRLPDRFEQSSPWILRMVRGGVAAAVAVAVFVFAIAASAPTPDNAVSDEIVARSLPDGHGKNVVNVILVDFRGIDTMGEITVLAVASIGAVALARAGRRPRVPQKLPKQVLR